MSSSLAGRPGAGLGAVFVAMEYMSSSSGYDSLRCLTCSDHVEGLRMYYVYVNYYPINVA